MYKQLTYVLIIIFLMCVANVVTRYIAERKGKPALFRITRDLMMIIYIGGVIYYTFINGRHTGIQNVILEFKPRFYKAIMNHQYTWGTHASFMNLCLFIPLGYLLPQFGEFKFFRNIRWWQITIIGFITTLIIEVSQLLLQRGTFELDDLIRNTMGTVVGFAIFKCVDIAFTHKSKN